MTRHTNFTKTSRLPFDDQQPDGTYYMVQVMMDPQTLQIKALMDWEYAGFFPPEMERWPGTLALDDYYKRERLVHATETFLITEYLKCYEK
ncbi:hypothetical protein GQ44DRAFT_780438 [Phaeosphaeriaceae sp. PMI808]|nr:hypothetical protein GQ44DRAFT_780438 [Phaeosphaeriaceae sp. PMI808]